MRSIWNGAISFGLVSIPVKLMNATENHSVSFRQVHLTDGGRIRYRKVCEVDDEEVSSAETGKAYEDADGTLIPITEDDLAALPLPTNKTIEILGFVPGSRIDPLQMDTAYYLSANGNPAAKPYTLLREALKRSEKVAVAKFALRGRERLGMLRVADDVIVMHGLLWPDELRSPDDVVPDTGAKVRDAELDLADALMNTLGGVDLDTLHDDYREAVEELVAAKAAGEPLEPAPEAETGGKVIDLVAALEKSVRAAKESRVDGGGADGGTGQGEVAEVHSIERSTRRSPTGKTAERKTPAKKAAGKSATVEKTAEKRSATKQPAAKKQTATEPAAKKTTAKKTTAKEPAAKKPAEKKTAPKKSAAKKTAAKKTAAKKTSAGGSAPSGRRSARSSA
ncbi:Ku protein [Streptomyces sp. AM 2-1-1]|uniref:non-homologous end joining protein Ku n=1 Tax=Streptomyces sp. AM 2-1-1 TaxID=3028709 RepID=UPI0023B9A860|nr:Ku protein [Streptomyces sp. AM 2-1-1]WEH43632.1 Ku protein [Streptomyces sp. AM 2-1-1]